MRLMVVAYSLGRRSGIFWRRITGLLLATSVTSSSSSSSHYSSFVVPKQQQRGSKIYAAYHSWVPFNPFSISITTTFGQSTDEGMNPEIEIQKEEEEEGLVLSWIDELNDNIRFILASSSPRRKEILDRMGLEGKYEIMPSPLDEKLFQQEQIQKNLNPREYTQILATEKARVLAQQISTIKPTLILASDTIVDFQGHVLEKPNNRQEAITTLERLSGQEHFVHTGVAIFAIDQSSIELVSSFVDTTRISFASLSRQDIVTYVDTGEPMDKAGSYGIQGMAGQFVQSIQGDFFTVMGLPMHRVSRELARAIAKLSSSSWSG